MHTSELVLFVVPLDLDLLLDFSINTIRTGFVDFDSHTFFRFCPCHTHTFMLICMNTKKELLSITKYLDDIFRIFMKLDR